MLLPVVLLACASSAQASIGTNDLVVNSSLTTTWVSGGSKPISVLSQPSDGTNRLVIDVTVDGANLAHVDCSCKVYGNATSSGGTTTYTPKQIAAYDTSTLTDGSAHTLVVNLTKYPSGESTSKTYTFNIDKTAPTPDPDGALLWAQNGLMGFIGPAGGTPTQYGLTVGGADELSGIAKVGWVETDAHNSTRSGSLTICMTDPCPVEVARDTNVTLYEGVHWLYATATDRAGNVAQTSKWVIRTDEKGPRTPTGLAALRDPDNGETYLVWDDGGDPLLSDTTAPSGTASYKYRYKIGSGAWTDVALSDDDYASIGTQLAGEPVMLEVTPVDAVGNVGPTTSGTSTITDSAELPIDVDVTETEPSTTAAPQTLATPGPKSVRCAGFGYQNEPTIDALGGESGIALNTDLSGYCWPTDPRNPRHVAIFEATKFTLKVCIQVHVGPGADAYRDIKCGSATRRAPSPGTPLKVSAAQLCRPGTQLYRLNIRATVRAPGFRPDSKVTPSNGISRPCNEAGAWRRIASYATSPGQTLGRALNAAGVYQDRRPAGDSSLGGQEGWEAHHIVPAGEGTTIEGPDNDNSAERAQRYAYDCGIEPNTAVNGVWLRGLGLVEGKPGYNSLDADGKRRAKHRGPGGVHGVDRRDAYYTYVGNKLGAYVNDATDACSNPIGAQSALQDIRGLLISGYVPTA